MHPRLVVHGQGILRQCRAQFALEGDTPGQPPVHRFSEETIAVSATVLDAIHGDVGTLNQRFRRTARFGVHGDTDACARGELVPIDNERIANTFRDFAHDHLGVAPCANIRQQQCELVAAETGNRVALSEATLQTLRHRLQKPIADRVPVLVVDQLESIEIQKHDRQAPTAATRLRHRQVEAVVQQYAVRQVCEPVVVRAKI